MRSSSIDLKKSTFKYFIALFLLTTLSGFSTADTLTIAVASNFTHAMKKLVAEFELQSGHKIEVAYGSSGRLYAQIINGAPFDVFFSADQQKPEQLEKDELILAGSRFTYAQGALALLTANENAGDKPLDLLQSGNFNKLAIANPKLAPYGQAAVETLEKLGLDQTTKTKWVVGENIAQTHQFVSTGNAELGFIALSQVIDTFNVSEAGDTKGSSKIKSEGVVSDSVWIVPSNYHRPINQDMVILKKENTEAAQALLAFIRSEAGKKIIRTMGYQVE